MNLAQHVVDDTAKVSARVFAGLMTEIVCDIAVYHSQWKPANDTWSILEIDRHLADEEEFDFRDRTKMTLAEPSESWPPIDPNAWAVERRNHSLRFQHRVKVTLSNYGRKKSSRILRTWSKSMFLG